MNKSYEPGQSKGFLLRAPMLSSWSLPVLIFKCVSSRAENTSRLQYILRQPVDVDGGGGDNQYRFRSGFVCLLFKRLNIYIFLVFGLLFFYQIVRSITCKINHSPYNAKFQTIVSLIQDSQCRAFILKARKGK